MILIIIGKPHPNVKIMERERCEFTDVTVAERNVTLQEEEVFKNENGEGSICKITAMIKDELGKPYGSFIADSGASVAWMRKSFLGRFFVYYRENGHMEINFGRSGWFGRCMDLL